ncbi:MAG: 23S rRNA (uracil(1939)-C(5))-methyltransferase RlmD, partial [Clostridia bacterium]|nr:23S rRNA (uracil(1939)-C(5))-methyltransferase RlmD [Clostridia bacterium]
MKKNDEFELEITGMTAEGNGVGHKDGMAVFVSNTAVGDTVIAHAIKVKKNYAVAKAVQIVSPSPDRTEVDCPVFNRCGGCVYRHISYDAELKIKQQKVADAFKRIGGLDISLQPIIGSDKINNYRNKAQLPVGKEKGQTKIGFYSFHSHNIIDCGCCLLQPKEFSLIADEFRSWIDSSGISVYDEASHSGLIRHLYIRASKDCREIAVCAVINGNMLPKADELWSAISAKGATGLSVNINKEKTNVILGNKTVALFGKPSITDSLLDTRFEISPLSFYQVNRAQTERLYSLAAEY